MKIRYILFGAILLTSLACSTGEIIGLFSPTAVPTATLPENTPTAEVVTLAPSDTPVIEAPTETRAPGETLWVDPTCVRPRDHDPLVQTSFEDMPNAILAYLNGGGGLDELAVVLTGFGVAHLPTTAVAGDMTGDTKDEIVVAIQDPAAQKVPSPGALLVYTCQGERFALAQIVLSQEFLSAPMIIHMQDLNADRRQELIYSSSSCGAHTCFEAVQILGWTGSAFENLLDGGTDDLPAPNMQITDYDLDGVYDLEVVGNGFGSVGAGPQRQVTRIWRYDPESGRWKIADESTGASNYRIHALHDADTTLRRGDYQIAIVLYNQVIHDDALLDWADKDNERLNLSAFAHFKTIVAYAFMDNLEQALEFFQSMSAAFPTGPQRSYVDLAQAFLNAFTAAGREAGCAAAHTFARENESRILAPLGSAVFGYANPDYAPEDVCP